MRSKYTRWGEERVKSPINGLSDLLRRICSMPRKERKEKEKELPQDRTHQTKKNQGIKPCGCLLSQGMHH